MLIRLEGGDLRRLDPVQGVLAGTQLSKEFNIFRTGIRCVDLPSARSDRVDGVVVMAEQSGALLKNFFRELRTRAKQDKTE